MPALYGALQPPTWWSSYAATYSPPTYHFCSQPASGSLSVLLPAPTTTPLSYPVTSPPFRRLICLYYGALQQPPTWWSSYAATYSAPPTIPSLGARPASGSPWFVVPPLSLSPPPPYYPYPVASTSWCRLMCLCYAALQPTVTHPTAAPQRLSPLARLSAHPRIMATAIDPAQPELPSYLLASEKKYHSACLSQKMSWAPSRGL
jgi:hypothetical protein